MNKYLLFLLNLCLLLTISCDKDDAPKILNEPENITTLLLELMPNGGGIPINFRFQDLDGSGGNAPFVMSSTLKSNTEYTGTIRLSDDSTPGLNQDLTVEISNEDEDHQLFYEVTDGLDLKVSYLDADTKGNPLGLKVALQTGNASSGTLSITLGHEIDKNAAGVSDGKRANAGGTTDLEVQFEVSVL